MVNCGRSAGVIDSLALRTLQGSLNERNKMKEEVLRFCMALGARQSRALSNERYAAGRKMAAGKICSSCKAPLPLPHTPVVKRCGFCQDKHLVLMSFRHCCGWRCRFTTEAKVRLPRQFTFNDATKVRELATRGNGLIDKWDRDGFELDLQIGRGGIWLRLSYEQYKAIGGVL
jgi:hypothetical protein